MRRQNSDMQNIFPIDYDRSPDHRLSQDELLAAYGIDDRLMPVVDAKFWHGVKVALALTACIALMGWFAAYRIFWS